MKIHNSLCEVCYPKAYCGPMYDSQQPSPTQNSPFGDVWGANHFAPHLTCCTMRSFVFSALCFANSTPFFSMTCRPRMVQWVNIYIYMGPCTGMQLHVPAIDIYVYACKYIYRQIDSQIYLDVCLLFIYSHIYIYIYTYTFLYYMHIHIYIYTHLCIYIYVYIYVYIYICL